MLVRGGKPSAREGTLPLDPHLTLVYVNALSNDVRLRPLRLSRGDTQAVFALYAGVNRSEIARVELGHRRLRPAARLRLARALGLSEEQRQMVVELRDPPMDEEARSA